MILIFILLLIVIIVYSISKSGGGGEFIYIYSGVGKNVIDPLYVVIYKYFTSIEFEYNYLKNLYTAMIFDNHRFVDYADYTMEQLCPKKYGLFYEEDVVIYDKYTYKYNIIRKQYIKKKYHYTTKKKGDNYIVKFEIKKVRNLEGEDLYNVLIFYGILNINQRGYQWSLYDMAEYKEILKQGLELEVFGSSLNARSKYFGSAFEIDEPAGRVGTYDFILNSLIEGKDIYWRKDKVNTKLLLINPPSTRIIVLDVIEKVLKLRGKHNIILQMPKKYQDDRLGSFTIKTHAYDVENSEKKDLKENYWIEYLIYT